ncbi:MAG: MAE_28990/MAE_18760 family HEPN-like nuclease [Klebsiella michiganensis]|nr:MAE_28990/MAE_18760 family HEPN-like nuclease [Klebsiella grimontii]MDU1517992.1 MAE_28990/MAE_18760 family HEPN-like nuclease [Klebsiella michiganensis]MDU1616723.1 MAE_28990/MAE_18760 family HEPN-like nuclease [Klebsiella michiganensis]
MGLNLLAETRDVVEERKKEIERQLSFIKKAIDAKSSNLIFLGKDGNDSEGVNNQVIFDRGLIKTLSASTYLLLYNLIECSMTNAIDSIHSHIKKENIGFHDLTLNMQKVALKNFRNALSKEENILAQGSIEHAMVWLGYDGEKLFSGNIDAKKIREMAIKYGFSISEETIKKSKGGRSLVMVKSKRNELAHGKISFEECGQECSIDELYSIYEQVIVFVDGIMDAIENYLKDKQYLKVSS